MENFKCFKNSLLQKINIKEFYALLRNRKRINNGDIPQFFINPYRKEAWKW